MAANSESEKNASPSKPPTVELSNTTTRAMILLTLNDIILSYPPKMRRHHDDVTDFRNSSRKTRL